MTNLTSWWSDWWGNRSFESDVLLSNAVTSLIFVIAVWLLRTALVRLVAMRATTISVENRRRWLVNIRNAIIFTIIAGLIFIWAREIQNVVFSLVAIAVAIVIATKELILCFSGAIFRTGTNAYRVGDCIEINGLRGDVIDQNLFGTTILELGPTQGSRQYTGRAIILPNSLLLSQPVVTETFMGDYVVHLITVTLSVHDDWQKAEEILLRVAGAECEAFLEDARKHMVSLEKKHWIDTPSVDPRVSIFCHDAQTLKVVLRVPTPARRKGRLEQAIIRQFLKEFQFVVAPPGVAPVAAGSSEKQGQAG